MSTLLPAAANPSTPNTGINTVALTILVILFLLVTVLGFMAARWRRAESMDSLDEWGLGGRSFGTWITWFLLGGDLYTAYTFVAVPAAMFATGAAAGFFAVPYTIVAYPIIFFFMSRMWSVSHRHGYVTPADFVRGRYDSRVLSLAMAVTGFVATLPYIALQLVGIQAVLEVSGVGGGGNWLAKDLPLIIAFAVLAAYTYSSGLRAPAIIAFVKDILIYLVIIVAIIYLPMKIGGWGEVFSATNAKTTAATAAKPFSDLVTDKQQWTYVTLAFGSAMALFMYPHSMTAVLSSNSRRTIRRNASILPAYSFMLAMLALLGWVAIAAKTKPIGLDGKPNAQLVIPQLFEDQFPSWFAGVAFAAIAIGALVPAAIMSIAAANTFTRNIYKEWLRPSATREEEAKVSKLVSLVVKVLAVLFVLGLDKQNAINLQLLGGIWILQTFPAIVAGLYTRWFHRWALLAGWAAAMIYGTYKAYGVANPVTKVKHFGGSAAEIPGFGHLGYIAVTALVLNVIVSVLLTVVLRAVKAPAGVDATRTADYFVDEGDPRIDFYDADPYDDQPAPGRA
ncbi:sodium:solute symporter family protein [Calidifontibacter sp. DB0510]|uniref:Sodium:solute symporter family protein n=1 Tax=Metallococcus carri TaxID=1656884 RepID=A0A967B1R4_9MICO|nr:sodium:solute symporter family protein [Metallococcus carri]NHN56422.1 sodium:solute symporter family protein [Metallococcus carri]NOP36046.1 sodium:solute symporter family protein [Calidifontibacter sp. DB2511S]